MLFRSIEPSEKILIWAEFHSPAAFSFESFSFLTTGNLGRSAPSATCNSATSEPPSITKSPTHHLRSHIAANYIAHPELKPPFLCLVVSGGHSHIVKVDDYTKMKIIGKTRDDAAGEAFDKAARTMGMSYPGGIHLDKAAEGGNENAFKLPHPVVANAPYDFSFSGLKTAIINLIHNASQKGDTLPVADLSASFRKAVVDCLDRKSVV